MNGTAGIKNFLASWLIALVLASPVVAGPLPAERGEIAHEIRCTVEFSEADLLFDQWEGYDLVTMKGAGVVSLPGKPILPEKTLRVAIPPGTEAVRVEARRLRSLEIPGSYSLMPGQEPRRTSERSSGSFIGPDEAIYGLRTAFPGALAVLEHQGDLAGQGIVDLSVYPLQYMPAERRLELSVLVEIIVSCRNAAVPENPLREGYAHFTDRQQRTYRQMLEAMVMNPGDVRMSPPPGLLTTALPDGEYDHVIITSAEFASAFLPLVDWHTQKGVRDTVVTPGWIYRNYDGPGDTLEIRQFIADASSNWGTMYFLLGGEHATVPFVYRNYQGEDTPGDQYYSDYDGDWTHEVFVGRAPVETTEEVATFVEKVLMYEKDPPLTDYPLNVLLLGFDLDSSTPCENLKEVIDGYLPSHLNVTKVYDSDPGDHYLDANAALGAGQNLVNHADHCGSTVMGVGCVNHGWLLSIWDVAFLANNDRTSIVVSMGCWPNAMDVSDCIAEHFVVRNPGQAGVAFNGNTRSGWYWVGDPQGLSCQLDRDWWRGIFEFGQNELGRAITWDKHQFPTGGFNAGLKKHCEWTFNLLGEPEMPLWLDTPDSLGVSFPGSIPFGGHEFTVLVESGGTPLGGARVCVMKKGEVYEVGITDDAGRVLFTVSPSESGPMDVTVTAQNHLPYEGTCQVVPPHARTPIRQ
jgi:hypothetical protein